MDLRLVRVLTPHPHCRVCLLGNRTLSRRSFDDCVKVHTTSNGTRTSMLWGLFCNGSADATACDDYFAQNNLTEIQGIPGVASGVLLGEARPILVGLRRPRPSPWGPVLLLSPWPCCPVRGHAAPSPLRTLQGPC